MTLDISSLLAEKAWVRALARSLLFDPDRADDVVQETWLAALESPPRQSSSLRGWLRSVVRNRSQNVLRGERRRHDREREVAQTEVRSDLDIDEHLDLHHRLAEAIVELYPVHRTVIYLRYFRDETFEAIGRETGVQTATARTRHRRVLERLRRAIASDRTERRSSAHGLFALAGLDPSAFTATSVATGGTGAAASLTVGGAVMSGKTAVVSITIISFAISTGVLYHQLDVTKEEAEVARKASELRIATLSERENNLVKKLEAANELTGAMEELRAQAEALAEGHDPNEIGDSNAEPNVVDSGGMPDWVPNVGAPFKTYSDLPRNRQATASKHGLYLDMRDGKLMSFTFSEAEFEPTPEQVAIVKDLMYAFEFQLSLRTDYIFRRLARGEFEEFQTRDAGRQYVQENRGCELCCCRYCNDHPVTAILHRDDSRWCRFLVSLRDPWKVNYV